MDYHFLNRRILNFGQFLVLFLSDFVFPIAIYHGFSKPPSLNDFLEDFVRELCELSETGITIGNTNIEFSLKALVCDAPARSFLKRIIAHTGYYSCERCVIKGERRDHRIVFNKFGPCEERTVEKFNECAYDDHQKGISPLAQTVNCIKDFPLDYMHLVLLGVLKRILSFLLKGPTICRISRKQISLISDRLTSYRANTPSDFNRKPRGLDDLCYWKATEFRLLLLYLGPVVFKGILSDQAYQNFLALHVSMSLLLSDGIESDPDMIKYSKELLKWFVCDCSTVYGEIFNVYNIHSLSHLPDDVVNHSCSLNDISAFKFENYMQSLKKCVRNSKNPVAQIVKRLTEKMESAFQKKIRNSFKINGKDVFFQAKDGTICEILNIVQADKYKRSFPLRALRENF